MQSASGSVADLQQLRRLYKMWADVWRNMDKAPEPSEKDVSMTACMKRLAASEDGEACLLVSCVP